MGARHDDLERARTQAQSHRGRRERTGTGRVDAGWIEPSRRPGARLPIFGTGTASAVDRGGVSYAVPVAQITAPLSQQRLQHVPPASTRKNASMSASVPRSPSPLKSGLQVGQHVPDRQEKKSSMSASVPISPSPLKSALPQG